MNFKALVLDFGGVVIKTPFELTGSLEQRLGIAPGTLDWRGPFDPAGDELWQKMQRHEISERDYWALRATEVGLAVRATHPWTTPDLMLAFYHCPESEFVRPEAIETMAAVSQANATVAVLTNDLAAFHGPTWFSSLALSKMISHLVDASLTGVLKPLPGAYARILLKLGIEADEALFVDDQPRNVEGSQRFGMSALAFDVTQPGESFERVRSSFGIHDARKTAS